jgi:hypothetical protein
MTPPALPAVAGANAAVPVLPVCASPRPPRPVVIPLDQRADPVQRAIQAQLPDPVDHVFAAVVCHAGLVLSDAVALQAAARIAPGPGGDGVMAALALLRPESRHLVDVLVDAGWIAIEGLE